jgi:hypothetical protein
MQFAPLVQSKMTSPNAAVSANVPIFALPPTDLSQSWPTLLLAVREPIIT